MKLSISGSTKTPVIVLSAENHAEICQLKEFSELLKISTVKHHAFDSRGNQCDWPEDVGVSIFANEGDPV